MPKDLTLSVSTVTSVIHAPLEEVDIADCLFNLPDAEYQRCSHAHIALGPTTADDTVRCRPEWNTVAGNTTLPKLAGVYSEACKRSSK